MRNRKERKAMVRRQYFKAAYYKAHSDLRRAKHEYLQAREWLQVLTTNRRSIEGWLYQNQD